MNIFQLQMGYHLAFYFVIFIHNWIVKKNYNKKQTSLATIFTLISISQVEIHW